MIKKILTALTKDYLDNYLEDYIADNFCVEGFMDFLNEEDLSTIKSFYLKVMDDNYESPRKKEYNLFKNKILVGIADFISGFAGEINVEGYTTFRMKTHIQDFHAITDFIMDDTMMDKTLDGVVEILKLSYEMSEPLCEEFHIDIVDDEYVITDEDGNDITEQALELDAEIDEIIPILNEVSDEDILMGAIVCSAPRKVYFKNYDLINDEFFKSELTKLLGKNLIIE
jgi:putative sporulation protein YtxC